MQNQRQRPQRGAKMKSSVPSTRTRSPRECFTRRRRRTTKTTTAST
jgi:hypothetical protein